MGSRLKNEGGLKGGLLVEGLSSVSEAKRKGAVEMVCS